MTNRFEALDAFRGICAVSVVVFHMHLIDSITELDFFRGSSVFVEFFFVLSGFVLTHGYGYKKNLCFKTFMKARFYRLYPLHFFMLVVLIAIEFGKLFAYTYGGFIFSNEPFTNDFAVSELIPNLLLVQSWTPFTQATSFNGPAWSISIEFYIYILLFFSIIYFESNKVISWFFISLITFSFIYLDSNILVPEALRGLSCFFGGAVTYGIFKKLYFLKPSVIIGSIIESILIACVFLIVQSKIEIRSILAPIIFFITVLAFAFESGLFSKLLKLTPFQILGKLSYSIYMTHYAVLFCLISAAMVIQKITLINLTIKIENFRYLNFGDSLINNVAAVFILIFIVYISSLTYKYVEINGQKLNTK